jgi:hypothetical protein
MSRISSGKPEVGRRVPRRIAATLVATAAMMALLAPSALAQNRQEGLVNVAVEDVVVQAPIALAANICDVNVAVLAEFADNAAACEATADATATRGPSSNQPTRQEGLVNVLVDDVLIQLPIAVAANVCDVNVAVLARFLDDAEACTATADAVAQPGPGGGPGGGAGTGGIVAIPVDVTLLDNNTATDGGPANLVDPGTVLDPLPAGLTLLG